MLKVLMSSVAFILFVYALYSVSKPLQKTVPNPINKSIFSSTYKVIPKSQMLNKYGFTMTGFKTKNCTKITNEIITKLKRCFNHGLQHKIVPKSGLVKFNRYFCKADKHNILIYSSSKSCTRQHLSMQLDGY